MNFKRIRFDNLIRFKDKPLDIYIQLSDEKFIKVISKDSTNFEEEFNHYKKKNLDFAFVDSNDFVAVLAVLKNIMIKNLSESEPPFDHVHASKENILYIQDMATQVGINEEDIKVIDNVFEKFNESMNKKKNLLDNLNRFLDRKDYIVNHSLLTSYLTTLLVQKLGWQNEQTYQRIYLASLFKDVAIENPFLSQIRNKNSPEFLNLTKEHKKIVIEHPEMGYKILSKNGFTDAILEQLILDHHELPDGTGFPRGLNAATLPPLSAAFNIACYFTQESILKKSEQTINSLEILKDMEPIFTKGNFKVVYAALHEIIKSNQH